MTSRHDRQIGLIGEGGQRRLSETTVAIVGCGGLGSNLAMLLAGAGIGSIKLIDGDSVSITNLNRQFILGKDEDVPKSKAAEVWVSSFDPDIKVSSYDSFLDEGNAGSLLFGCDIIADCLDTVRSRRVLNRYALRTGTTIVHAGISGLTGQVMVMVPGETPCLECILRGEDGIPPSIGFAVSFIASIQASEIVKLASGIGSPLIGKLLTADLSDYSVEITSVGRDTRCLACSDKNN